MNPRLPFFHASHLVLLLLLCLMPSTRVRADIITYEKLHTISDCTNDATRLDEGWQLACQLAATPGVEHEYYYAQLLYLQAINRINSGDIALAKTILLSMLQKLDDGSFVRQDLTDPNLLTISVPHDLGLCYRRESKNDSALFYYERALAMAREQGDVEWQAALCHNIGVLHFNLGHIAEAEQLLDRGVELVQQVDDPYTELCLLQVRAGTKLRLNKIDEARQSIEPAYELSLLSESPDWQLRCLTSMLSIYDAQRLPDSVAVVLQRADVLLPQLPQTTITVMGYLTARGNYFMAHQQWQQAIDDFLTVLDGSAGGVQTQEFFSHLAACYAQLNQWQPAYRYKDSAAVYASRETEAQFSAQLADFNVRYQTMEKDMQISRLEAQRSRFVFLTVAGAVVLLLLLTGLWLWQRQRRFRQTARLRISTLEKERARIARELHDGLCNDMLALEMRFTADGASDQSVERLSQLRQQARLLSHQLMPPQFDRLTLPEMLSLYTRQLQTHTQVAVDFTDATTGTATFDQATALELYRIVQEHTANIVKGGTARHISITLDNRQLDIADDGQPQPQQNHEGIGQRTIADRAVSIGASISTATDDNGHNVMSIQLP